MIKNCVFQTSPTAQILYVWVACPVSPPLVNHLSLLGTPKSERYFSNTTWNAVRDLMAFVQFKKREKHPWRNVTFIKVECCSSTKINTPPWVFFTFLKLYKWYQIAQNITYNLLCTLCWRTYVQESKMYFQINVIA